MLNIYQQLATELQKGSVVLAAVVDVKGSVPREVGAMILLCCDGSTIGTIGGGAGEASVIERARHVLVTGQKQLVDIDLSGNLEHTKQGICGGMMQVWLERWQGDGAIALANQIVALLHTGQSGCLVIPMAPERSPYLSTPHTPHPTPVRLSAHVEAHFPTFTLPLLPPPTLLIIGAGHVAVPLAQMAHLLDFHVAVQDDRPEFANVQRFPDATILAQPIATAIATVNASPQLYVALVTRGYQHDLAALKVLLPRSPQYIGMIGSEKRVRTVLQALQQESIPGVEEASVASQLQAVYAPIGLDLGALTPAEIAVSICAELITVYRGGSGRSLSRRSRSSQSQPLSTPTTNGALIKRQEQQAQQQ
ncbi:XdhC family protein [Stenomitos frigidus]|uniref:Xanthine dehydrogenase n=1 Tax=Stenomitos frigidus ULC18 TaxID=2107698 RepID=A0A2T1EAM7_9CYAN|nr:XdhC/CoxI family protein [Stenomitos frigidus]PSB29797.1 xanthine dehydrogenase [Stenomitos frigidus ULC18]